MSEAKLDAAGEAQQIMMMLAMWREIMNMAKPAPPPPIPRPIELIGNLGQKAILTMIDDVGDGYIVRSSVHENTTAEELQYAIKQYIEWRDEWVKKLNAVCWRVSIPDQPVMLRSVRMTGQHRVDEILTVPMIDPSNDTIVTHPVRLGWLPGPGLSELQDMFNAMAREFAKSAIVAIFDKRSTDDKRLNDALVRIYCPRLVDYKNDENSVYGRIIDGWLFVYPNLEGERL